MYATPMEGSFVTILVADLVGLPELYERRGDEAADAVRREHLAALRAAASEHGGREAAAGSDGLTLAFPSAVAAVRCAAAMQRAVAALGAVGLSVGLDAGEPVGDAGELYGTPVIVAGRLCDAAAAGEILASEVVCRIAAPRVDEPLTPAAPVRLRGLSAPVPAAHVLWDGGVGATPPPGPSVAARQVDVVLADDQRLVRAGFRVILDAEPDIRVVGQAADGRTAVDVVRRTRPDVVLMDIRMPELDGLQAAQRILGDPELETAVVMLTTFDRDQYIYEALRIGASGFLLKDAPADRLLDAVRAAAAGDALLAPSITRRLVAEFARVPRRVPGEIPEALADLTRRELEVLRLLARGLSNAEIATRLVLGENTVKTHVARVLRKLGLRDRVQAVVLAYESGLVTPQDGDDRRP